MIMFDALKVLTGAAILAGPAAAWAEGDAARGQRLFNRCSACHTIDGVLRSGPPLNGLIGRKAGTAEGFRYSDALSNSNITWTAEALDAYLSSPAKMVRGTRMTTSVVRPKDRSDIISYLETLSTR